MDFKVEKLKDGVKGCGVCNGTGYYTTHTDRANEDGGVYTNRYPCKCNKKYGRTTADMRLANARPN